MEFILRDGSRAADGRLDRLVQFDERSRSFPIRSEVEGQRPRSYTWSVGAHLDQGREGACVGFAMAHELIARPAVVEGVTASDALRIYKAAQKIDPWPGEDYEGTSTLAGVKTIASDGHLKEYRWAFGLEDLILAVGYHGPALIGVNWYEGMFDTDRDGFIHHSGLIAGGHCTLVHSVNVPGEFFRIHNSWGPEWGVGGDAKISWVDMGRLLAEDGEACIPTVRIRHVEVGSG
ncbi:MAG TPA: hypothetical protein VMW08_01015 [Acidimicrobiales bacterium]|nr:hypothetical protein [Acidimicrobiales bacterium]